MAQLGEINVHAYQSHHSKDFYKAGHPSQYPPKTEYVYSNFTARSDTHAKVSVLFDHKAVWFGLQGFVKWFLIDTWNSQFFNKPKAEVIAKYKRRMDTALGADSVPVSHLAALHDLGFLPILIKALPEGSRVNIKVPFFTVQSTMNEFFWLTNYIETVLSDEVWKPTTVATIAFEYRRILDAFVELTGSSPEFADWQNHDFAMRGMSGMHDSASSGAGHLLSNFGTDTVPAIDYLENYYNADAERELIGGSVPATEHAVMCAGGAGEGDERETIRRIIQDVYPSGIVSVVSDTWDFWKVITQTALDLKLVILDRKPNPLGQAKVVFRPDSGDPVHILCGYWDDELELITTEPGKYTVIATGEVINKAARIGAVECLWGIFGGTLTHKGYRTLHERVGLIYGDSITLDRQYEIFSRLAKKGFSAGNVVLGIGSYTYQLITRDTFGMAMKATYAIVDRVGRELFKDPKTDSGGVKKSAKGLLRVEKVGQDFVLHDMQSFEQEGRGALEVVFQDGVLVRDMTLAQVRANVAASKVAERLPAFA
ncbi:nicotinate phosphoribosyltransferase [Polaromonas sp. P1(28)-13]|nr:nicotinate phosphoribosyltransferase [Polaromonas sp. P1(28)-13]